jgi:hypothetical protein
MDHSAIEAINSLTDKYKKQWKKLHLIHLSAFLQSADKWIKCNFFHCFLYFSVREIIA